MKLRIAYCVSHFPYQSETYLLNQLKELIDDGHKVTIFSWGRPANYPKHALVEEYGLIDRTIERPSIPQNRFLRFVKALYLLLKNVSHCFPLLKSLNFLKYGQYAANLQFFYDTVPFIRQREFDIVHCQFGPNGIKAVNFRELGLLKGKLITSFHGFDVNDREFLSWPSHYSRKGLYRDLIPQCEAFTVSSSFTMSTAEALGIPPEKIVVLPVGLDTGKFKKQGISGSSAKPILLTIARLVPFKGLKYSVEAVKILQQSHTSLEYHIVGEGVLRRELEEQIKKLQLEEHVFLHGAVPQEEVIRYYSLAQVFILAGIVAEDGEVETQGLAVQEAQSMELPVVVSNAGGLPEGVIDGATGFIVPQKNVMAIVEKVDLLLRNPELMSKMGEAGRKYVEEHFDNKVQHRKLMQLYQEVMLR